MRFGLSAKSFADISDLFRMSPKRLADNSAFIDMSSDRSADKSSIDVISYDQSADNSTVFGMFKKMFADNSDAFGMSLNRILLLQTFRSKFLFGVFAGKCFLRGEPALHLCGTATNLVAVITPSS